MNESYLQFLLRYGPLIHIILLLAFIAIPIALFMIWNELAKLNEHFRIERTLRAARSPFEKA